MLTTETQVVAVDGGSLRCRIDGPDREAPWLVFSNSLVSSLEIWDGQVIAFSERYRILRYDQRGHGGSSPPEGSIGFADLGGDVAALLDHFEIARATFVGLSMGVPTGLALMARQPQRVERLVLSDGLARSAPDFGPVWEGRIAHGRAQGMAAVADATLARWFAPEVVATGAVEPVRWMAAATSLAGFAACAGALKAFDYEAVLPTIRVPTLLIAGERDGTMPQAMRAMAEAIPGAALVIIADAGHVPNFEMPVAFNRALAGFLDPAPAAG